MAGALALVAFVVIGLTSGAYAPQTMLGPVTPPRQHALATGGGSENAVQSSPSTHSSPAGQHPSTRRRPGPARRHQARRHQEAASTVAHRAPACSLPRSGHVADCRRSGGPARTTGFSSVLAAFNGDGVAPADSISRGNFDGGGFSFEARQLDADGFGPGDKVAAAGRVLTLPDVPSGAPDEITAKGQVIHLGRTGESGGELGFLGAGKYGTQGGTVAVTYTDGSTRKATLKLADWYADAPAPGSVIAASGPWNVPPSQTSAFGLHTVAVYYRQIRVDPAKTVASVTLPRNPLLHLFDIGVPAPARYPSVPSAYDDTGLAPAAAPRDGNYDGAGNSYDSGALAAAGLRPGARVTAQGVHFTWPHYALGRFDNIRAEGQTIAVPGSGRVLGFLGAGVFGTQRGTVRIHYTDGATESATLSLADWYAGSAVAGGTVVASAPWTRPPGTGAGPHPVSVYSAVVPLRAGQTVASVTLPVNFKMHVFAIAEGGRRR